MKKRFTIVILLALLSLAAGPVLAGEIHDACQAGDLQKVKTLLAKNPELLQSKTKEGKSPLHMATGWKMVEIVKFLLSKNADIKARNNNGGAPLHVAASQNSPNCAILLIAAGTSPNIKVVNPGSPMNGATPMHWSAFKNTPKVAKILLDKGGDVNAQTQYGGTPLHFAASRGNMEMIEFLITNKANVNAKTHNGMTPRAMALKKGNKQAADYIGKHGGK